MFKLYRNGLSKYTGPLILTVLLLVAQAFTMLWLPDMMSVIIDRGVVTGNISFIVQVGFLMLLIALGGSAASIGVGYLSSRVGVNFCTDIRAKLFAHINTFTMREFDKIGTSSLVTRSTNDVVQLQNFTVMFFRIMVLSPIVCLGGILMALAKNAEMSLIIFICMPIVILVLIITLRRAFPVFNAMQDKLDKVNLILRESITGVRVIRAFDAQEREEARFTEANAEMTANSIRAQLIMSALMPMLMLIINIGTVAVVWFGGQQISMGMMEVGDMMAFIQYLVLIMYSLIMMSMIFAMLPRARVCAERIEEVMEIEPDIQDPPHPKTAPPRSGTVEFRDVALAYHAGGKNAISHISFTASPGKTTALIGATGSGKSSVICLIPRLRDVTEGQVLVDGLDVREYALSDLRRRIAYVPQKANLFAGTIRSNIAYEDEQMPMAQVERAARIARADTFIREKPKGYDDPIAQGGTNVSGGQRQRLTIARALAAEAPIMIFDDSFSALDFRTDAELRAGIREAYQDATLIIVAQRVNTILNADEILVLENGEIVGRGRHGELLKTCPVYAEIAKTQLAQEEEA